MVKIPEFIIAGLMTTLIIVSGLFILWENDILLWIDLQKTPMNNSKLITALVSIGVLILFIVVFKNLLAGIVGAILVVLYRKKAKELKQNKKNTKIEEQAEVALQLITALYENNHDLMRSIKQAGDCTQPPLSDELKRTVNEYYAGKPAMISLKDFAGRVNNRDIDVFVKGVMLSEHYGTDTSRVIQDVTDIMSDRITLREELRNEMKGQSLTISIFLSVLPVVTIGAMFFPEMRQVLVGTPLGKSVIIIMIVIEYIAWHFTQRQTEVNAL